MNKLQMAHEMALAIQGTKLIHDMELVSDMAWKYVDAMQAEADKREPSGFPNVLRGACGEIVAVKVDDKEQQPDWSQAPDKQFNIYLAIGEKVIYNLVNCQIGLIDMKCKVDDCFCEKIKALGMCSIHYRRYSLYGDVNYLGREYHGMSKTTEYKSWRHMKERCLNKNDISYSIYGGRGITVCSEWIGSFETFLKDMGKKPSKKHQIDRIDNNGNYFKENCRWVLPCENSQNRRSTKLKAEDVIKIRESTLGSKELSLMFDVTQAHIIDIKERHRGWEKV